MAEDLKKCTKKCTLNDTKNQRRKYLPLCCPLFHPVVEKKKREVLTGGFDSLFDMH